jgi:hypothetical protein
MTYYFENWGDTLEIPVVSGKRTIYAGGADEDDCRRRVEPLVTTSVFGEMSRSRVHPS